MPHVSLPRLEKRCIVLHYLALTMLCCTCLIQVLSLQTKKIPHLHWWLFIKPCTVQAVLSRTRRCVTIKVLVRLLQKIIESCSCSKFLWKVSLIVFQKHAKRTCRRVQMAGSSTTQRGGTVPSLPCSFRSILVEKYCEHLWCTFPLMCTCAVTTGIACHVV